MVNIVWSIVVIGVILMFMAIGAMIFFYMRGWRIPVVIFKLVGDKRRPILDLSRKAKIIIENGVKRLKIRGTPHLWEMRNFKNENYFLDIAGRPSLVLFEFSKDCYTPYRPLLLERWMNRWKKITPDQSEKMEELPVLTQVGVKCDAKMFSQLLLKAVDDFDPDFIVRNFGRIDRQYTGNLSHFLKESGWIIGWLLLFMLALVGGVLFLQKSPEIAAQCTGAALDATRLVLEQYVSNPPAG